MKSEKPVYIPIIDGLRGLAATLVCFYHFVCTTTDYFESEMVLNLFSFGKYGVQMFFVISGIVIPLSMINGNYQYKHWWAFIKKRFVRIEPPYLVSIAIAITLLWLRQFVPGLEQQDLLPTGKEILLHIGYLIPFFDDVDWINSVYWTLAIEFQYYLVLCLIFPIALKGKLYLRVLFYSVFVVSVIFQFGNGFLLHWVPLFLMGIVYVLYVSKRIHVLEFLICLLVSAGLTIVYIGFTDFLFGIVTLLIVDLFTQKKNKVFKFFGNISYSLYLVHTIIGAAFVNYFSHSLTVPYQKVILVMCGYAISVIFAFLMYKIVEKPFKKLSSNIRYK